MEGNKFRDHHTDTGAELSCVRAGDEEVYPEHHIVRNAGIYLYYKASFFMPMMDALLEATCDADNNYIVVICLLFGCFVQLLRQSKGAMAVADMARRYVKSEKQVLLMTWICGVIIFIDDYLSILVTANCVLDLSDEYKTPREMLCYIINTTSAAVMSDNTYLGMGSVFLRRIRAAAGGRSGRRQRHGHLLSHHAAFLLSIPVRDIRTVGHPGHRA